MADAAAAGDEDHGGRCNTRDHLGVVAGAGGHTPVAETQASRRGFDVGGQGGVEDDWFETRETLAFDRHAFALGDFGEEVGKPVVATGDVHFLDPHNAINRSIIQAGMGYDDADMQPPLYFKTTNEMLEEFAYLGAEKCHEVVIDNPRKIADQVDKLQLFPKHPKGEDTFQPFWEDAADNIQNMTWGTAKELYGELIPVPAERIVEATEGLELNLAGRVIRVFDTPGHARHHVCYFDTKSRSFFTGDTFGLSYRALDVAGRPSIFPTTTPVQFEPDAMHDSIRRMEAEQPAAMYLTHYAQVTDVPRLAADLHRLIDAHVAVAEHHAAAGEGRKALIEADLWKLVDAESARQGWTLPQAQVRKLLALDVELNAQGLDVWLGSR